MTLFKLGANLPDQMWIWIKLPHISFKVMHWKNMLANSRLFCSGFTFDNYHRANELQCTSWKRFRFWHKCKLCKYPDCCSRIIAYLIWCFVKNSHMRWWHWCKEVLFCIFCCQQSLQWWQMINTCKDCLPTSLPKVPHQQARYFMSNLSKLIAAINFLAS